MWIIQDKIFGDETDLLIKALENNNVEYKLFSSFPDLKKEHSIRNGLNSSQWFIRGSIEFVEKFQTVFKKPFNLTLDNYTYTTYSKYFHPTMLNSNFIVLPWWALKSHKVGIFNSFPKAEKFFIRPNSGRKIFTGTTLTKKWWDKELDIIKNLPSSNIKDEDLVIISSFKKIEKEYRLLMYKDILIDHSLYSGKSDSEDILLINFWSKIIDFFPDDLYTVDLAFTEESVKLLEINSAVSAGWYDMNYDKVIQFLRGQYGKSRNN